MVLIKNYNLFMTVNKGFKSCITNRPEIDDTQNTVLSKDANVTIIVIRPPKTQS